MKRGFLKKRVTLRASKGARTSVRRNVRPQPEVTPQPYHPGLTPVRVSKPLIGNCGGRSAYPRFRGMKSALRLWSAVARHRFPHGAHLTECVRRETRGSRTPERRLMRSTLSAILQPPLRPKAVSPLRFATAVHNAGAVQLRPGARTSVRRNVHHHQTVPRFQGSPETLSVVLANITDSGTRKQIGISTFLRTEVRVPAMECGGSTPLWIRHAWHGGVVLSNEPEFPRNAQPGGGSRAIHRRLGTTTPFQVCPRYPKRRPAGALHGAGAVQPCPLIFRR